MKRHINLGIFALVIVVGCLGVGAIVQAKEIPFPISESPPLAEGGGDHSFPQSYFSKDREEEVSPANKQVYGKDNNWHDPHDRRYYGRDNSWHNDHRYYGRDNSWHDDRDNVRAQIYIFYHRTYNRDPDDFCINYYLGHYYNDGWSIDRIQQDISISINIRL